MGERTLSRVADDMSDVSSWRASDIPFAKELITSCRNHPCHQHEFFARLANSRLDTSKVANLLRNYDAHASLLRRLLLKAAAIMPEEACSYVLENVRNEYGNGDSQQRHQLQLIDLALKSGVSKEDFDRAPLQRGVRLFMSAVVPAYYPLGANVPAGCFRPAIAAGAITATEILAVKEFEAMHRAFSRLGLGEHIWFDHLTVEADHTIESLSLAIHFMKKRHASRSVLFGLRQVLDANLSLYEGLLEAIS